MIIYYLPCAVLDTFQQIVLEIPCNNLIMYILSFLPLYNDIMQTGGPVRSQTQIGLMLEPLC